MSYAHEMIKEMRKQSSYQKSCEPSIGVYVGTVQSEEPIKISLVDGEVILEEEMFTKTRSVSSTALKKGMQILFIGDGIGFYAVDLI